MEHTRKQADVTAGDVSNPVDDLDNDVIDDDLDNDAIDDDLDNDAIEDDLDDDLDDDVIERLRRLDPVDVESLPSSRGAEAMKTLEEILGPDEESGPGTESESETGTDESSPSSPVAVGRDGEEAPPPCSTSR